MHLIQIDMWGEKMTNRLNPIIVFILVFIATALPTTYASGRMRETADPFAVSIGRMRNTTEGETIYGEFGAEFYPVEFFITHADNYEHGILNEMQVYQRIRGVSGEYNFVTTRGGDWLLCIHNTNNATQDVWIAHNRQLLSRDIQMFANTFLLPLIIILILCFVVLKIKVRRKSTIIIGNAFVLKFRIDTMFIIKGVLI